jgi:hypothetical protein
MSEMSNFRHRHLQIGRMLDHDLIQDLRLKAVIKLFRKTEIKDCAFYLELCTGSRSNCFTFDHISWGGGEDGGGNA